MLEKTAQSSLEEIEETNSHPAKPSLEDKKKHTIPDYVKDMKSGRKEAFTVFAEQHGEAILRLALKITKNETEAEEVRSDIYLKMLEGKWSFSGNSSFKTWLYRVIVNQALMKLRNNKKDITNIEIDDYKKEFHENLISPEMNGEQVQLDRELGQIIQQAIARLDKKKWLALDLQMDGLRISQITQMLNDNKGPNENEIDKNGVKTRIHRGRKAIRESLNAYY